nr:NAD(+) diphosphatase [uncultured Methanoregula sp.]
MDHIARFEAGSLSKQYPLPGTIPADARIVAVRENEVCVRAGRDPTIFLPPSWEIPESMKESPQYLGNLGPAPCYVLEIPRGMSCPDGFVLSGARELAGRIPEEELAIAGLALQIDDYNRTTRFCGKCGTRTVSSLIERAKICPACNHITYARLSPAIVVLVRKDESILMVHGKQAPKGRFSLVAGFVEPGETIEHAVHREVREEAGIEISHVRYLASEPWPFPNSLMIAFVADYANGTVTPDGTEIESAGWFDRNTIPNIPPKISITHMLITRWISGDLPES